MVGCLLSKIGANIWWLFVYNLRKLEEWLSGYLQYAIRNVSISITAGIASTNTDIKTTVTAGGSTTTNKHKIRIATMVCVY